MTNSLVGYRSNMLTYGIYTKTATFYKLWMGIRAIRLHLVDILFTARRDIFQTLEGDSAICLYLVDTREKKPHTTFYKLWMDYRLISGRHFRRTYSHISCKTMQCYRDSTWDPDGHSCKTTEVQRGNHLKYRICFRHEKNKIIYWYFIFSFRFFVF